ncbi:MAG: hypothetical protein K8R35_03745 [Bacteroidales bacterium]|nr:hypothetical protein [Bacteroidales bacterium]
MKNNTVTRLYLAILICIIISGLNTSKGQTSMPAVMDTGSLEEQMKYINDRTRIYENYRAIREDIFQKMKNNALDSLNKAKQGITELNNEVSGLNEEIANLNNQLTIKNSELEEAVSNRDTLMFFSSSINKATYNKILWSIIIGLVALTVFTLLLYKRSHIVTRNATIDLEHIKREFEDFRRIAHENKEKLIVSHINEIKKLKGH